MSDWKSQFDVTDQGAYNAGVYGQPNSTWDIARAQEESNRLRLGQSAATPAPSTYLPPAYPTAYPTAYPGYTATSATAYADDGGGSSWLGKLVLVLLLGAGLVLVAPVWLPAALGLLQGTGVLAPEVTALDTAHYRALSAEASRLSAQSTTRLYAAHRISAAAEWDALSVPQREAVAAAWIRYTRNPAAFDRLPAKQRALVFASFESYLTALARQGDAHAAHDVRRLRLRRR